MQDPYARLYSAFDEEDEHEDPFGRLYSAVGPPEPEGRPLTDRDLSEMASAHGGAGIPLEDRTPPGEIPPAASLTDVGPEGAPRDRGPRLPDASARELMGRKVERAPPYDTSIDEGPSLLELGARGVATVPGMITEGLGAQMQATSAEPPSEEEVHGPTTGGFLEAIQEIARKIPLPKLFKEEPVDAREALESGRAAVRGAGREVERVGRESEEHFAPAQEPTDPSSAEFWSYQVPRGLGQVGTQLALARLGGGGTAAQVGRFTLPSVALEGGQHYIETREQLMEEGASREEAERQAAAESGIVSAGSAATEAVPGAALLRPLKAARGAGRMLRGPARRLLAGPAEAAQEATQEAIASGVSYAGGDERALEELPSRMAVSGGVGGAVGTIAGGGGAFTEAIARRGRPQEDTETVVEPVVTGEEAETATEAGPTPVEVDTETVAAETEAESEAEATEEAPSEARPRRARILYRDVVGRVEGEPQMEQIARPGRGPNDGFHTVQLDRSVDDLSVGELRDLTERLEQRTTAAREGLDRTVDEEGEAEVGGTTALEAAAPAADLVYAHNLLSEAEAGGTEVDAGLEERSEAGDGTEVDETRPLTGPTVENLRETRRKLAEHRATRERMLSGEIGRSNLDRLTQEIQDLSEHERRLARQLRNMGADPDAVQPGDPLERGRAPDEASEVGEATLGEPARPSGGLPTRLSEVPVERDAPERVIGAATKIQGEDDPFVAQTHPQAVLRAREEGVEVEGEGADAYGIPEAHGFATSHGRFVAREEAHRIAEETGDLQRSSRTVEGELDAMDLEEQRQSPGLEETVAEEQGPRLRGPEQATPETSTTLEGPAEPEPTGRLRGPRAERVERAFPETPLAYEPGIEDARAVVEGTDPFAPAPDETLAEPETDEDAQSPIGGRMRGHLERPEDWDGGAVNRSQVRNELAKALEAAGGKVPLRLGRTPTGSRGVFKVRPEVVRVRQAGDLPNAWHETAHALEKLVYGWPEGSPWTSPLVGEQLQNELEALGRDLYGDQKPAGGYRREGFAEFLKRWGTEDPTLEQVAPGFTAWFEGTFLEEHPEVDDQLRTAREATRTWREQGAAERARQSIQDPAAPSRRLRRAWRRIKETVGIDAQVEALQPLYEMAEVAEERLGEELDPSEHPYIAPAALATVESTRTKYMIQKGGIDLAGNRTGGPALKDVAGLVKKAELPDAYADFSNREAFTIYLWARRTRALHRDPEGERESGMSPQDANRIINDLESEEFETAAGLYYQWNQDLLDYAAEASPTFAEIVSRVRERDPGAYMPLQRVFDEMDDMWSRAAARGGPAGPTSPVSRLKGSSRAIKDPIQVSIAQAEQTMRAAHRRLTLDNLIRVSGVEGMGHLIEEVEPEIAPVATRNLQDVLRKIRSELGDDADLVVQTSEGEDLDLTARTLTFFAPARAPSGPDAPAIVPLYDGEQDRVRWFRLDKDVMQALESLVPQRQVEISGIALADEVMKKWSRAFRAGTTTLRASFGLVWNMMRDPQTMWVNSRSSAAGPRLFVEWVRGMVQVGYGKVTGQEAGEWVDTYMRLGVEMSQSLGQDIPHTRTAARQIFQGRVMHLDPRNWFEWYRELVQFPEAAPRLAEMKTVAEDIGWQPGEPMNLDQSLQMLLAAKQVTTDFTAAGHLGRKINQVVPFYNASIQGPRANLRAARRNPKKFMLRGLQLTVLSLLGWWKYKDEDWWKEMDPREKFLHWHIPIDWPESTLVRIPRAFEVGLVFSALPEALLDGWYRQNPEEVAEWFDVFRESSIPPLLPQPAQVVAEQLANERFFFDSPIVPMSVERKPAEEQFNEYTSRLAVELGDLFNASPMRIDHALQGVFGRVGGDLLDVLGMGRPERDREKELSDLPVVGRMFMRGGRMGRTKTVDELYDTLEEAQKRQASSRHQETERQRQLRLQLQDGAKAISALFYLRQNAREADKRRQLNELITSFSRRALEDYRSGRLIREEYKQARKRLEGAEETLEARLEGRQQEEDGRLGGRLQGSR